MDAREEELIKILQEASNGNWYPAIIVGGLFSLLFLLSGYIVKLVLKTNEGKHAETYKLLEKIVEANRKTDLLVTKLETIISYHEKDIEDLKHAE